MKLKLENIIAAKPALTKLLNADVPVATAFKLSKLVKIIDNELASYEDARIKLVQKFGEDDGAGTGNITVTNANLDAFTVEIGKLQAVEVELPGEPISVGALGEIKMSAVDLSLMEGMLI